MTALRQPMVWLFALILCFAAGCGNGEPDPAKKKSTRHAAGGEDPAHAHAHGPHGGELIQLDGGGGQVEFLHDAKAGRIDLHVLGTDGKSPLAIEAAPAINLKTAEGPRRFECQPVDAAGKATSHFQGEDKAFKTDHICGQIAISVAGKDYFVEIPHLHQADAKPDHAADAHQHEDDGQAHAGHDHGENTISRTIWTDRCEWFVELDNPQLGHAASFAAHITRLDGFKPVTAGEFRVEARSGAETTSAHAATPARPGIFTPSITFPAAGPFALVLTYTGPGGLTDSIEWEVQVHEHGKVPEPEEDDAGAISFLKEQQWKIPFATVPAARRTVGGETGVIAIPEAAIREEAGQEVVYVQTGGESFERRTVQPGKRAEGWVEIPSAVKKGERVVTRGAEAIQQAAGRK